jgi:glycerol-3-phosphate dehydrogenase
VQGAPLINSFGGKITTYRRLSESMLEKIEGFLGARGKPGLLKPRCRAATLIVWILTARWIG